MRMGDFGDRLQIDDNTARIGQTLDEDRLALWGQRTPKIFRVSRIDEMAGPADFPEGKAELREGAAVEVARGEEFITRFEHGGEDKKLSGMAGGGSHRSAAALEAGDSFLQHRDGR